MREEYPSTEYPHYVYRPPNFKIVYFIFSSIIAIILFFVGLNFYTEYLWFESVGFGSVYIKYILYSIEFYLLLFVPCLILLILNNLAVRKITEDFLGEPFKIPFIVDFIFASLIALVAFPYWKSLIFYMNSTDFGLTDPVFGLDASFYVFKLPFLRVVGGTIAVAAVFSLMVSILSYAYVFRWVRSFEEFKEVFPPGGFIHLAALTLLIFLISAYMIILQRFELVFSQHGLISGASYVEAVVKAPAMLFGAALCIIAGVVSAYFIFRKDIELAAYPIIVFVIIYILAIGVLPFAIQKFQVEPSELAYESRYIGYSINYTLYAYGLNDVRRVPFNFTPDLSIEDVMKASATLDNVRIWDHRPILDVFKQLQQIRTYYSIKDVDVDRYWINGSYVQLMIAARELSVDLLPSRAQTWLNRHLIYTHGYGVVAAPVNSISKEGLPELVIYDIPPRGEIQISRPEIYYGEQTGNYVVVNTSQEEFDYPVGDVNYFTKYKGTGGVKLDSLRKILYAMRFGDVNLILSSYITEGSKLLFHRNIVERASTIAPFFKYDRDPYVAVIEGKIFWIIDAYTLLDGFPYSAKVEGYEYGIYNYMRNPVKVFIDAYNGTVTFYVVQEDAYVKTLENAFPELFTYQMPEEFRKHIRYPRDYFEVQAAIYSIYHMTDVTEFYNREDVWQIPKEKFENNIIDVEPYYVTLSLDSKPEFVLMLPLTPKGRDNLIAWMGARCDEKYGELLVYEFPKGELIYGPMQIDARIDQDAELSKLFTLWGQVGSRVIRGNLLVIPINNSLLYIEPVYLRAESAKIPELRGVIVVHNDILKMGDNLYDAIEKVFGVAEKPEAEKPPQIPQIPAQEAVEKLEKIREYYSRFLDALKSGNWSEAGEMIEKIGEVLGVQ
jgi:hypothetical protein